MYKIKDVFYENKYHIFVEYLSKINMHYMSDLEKFDFNTLKEVKGIGVSKITSIEKKYEEYINNNSLKNIFLEIHKDNYNLSIETLTLFGISKNTLSALNELGINTIKDLSDYGNSNLYNTNSNLYKKVKSVISYYKEPLAKNAKKLLADFKEEEHSDVILLRSMGVTLSSIGTELEVTRERVRQIETVKLKKLKNILDIILDDIVRRFDYQYCINLNKLELYFSDPDDITLIKYALFSSYREFYLEFCNKMLINGDTRDLVLDRLNGITQYYIKDMVNFTSQMVVITESLSKNNIPYIDIEDLTNYLLLNGYIKKGNYIFKAGISYGLLCALIVRKHFRNGIKIHDDNDLQRLREIVYNEFDGLELPDNNRALGTRISCFLVLCDRGCYTSPSRIKIQPALLNEIYDYIMSYSESTMFFNDIFVHFKDKLLKNSNINNRYYLQGILKHYYEYDFVFERDSLTKKGQLRKNIRELIADFVKSLSRPVHRREIKAHFPGATDVVITNAQLSNDKLLQWEYNYYIHEDSLDITDKDKSTLENALEKIFADYRGYSSEQMLFDSLSDNKDLFIRNHIKTPSNLFYMASHLFKDKYMFRRPHILKDKSESNEMSSRIIVEKFLMKDGILKYSDYQEFVSEVKWSIGATYAVFKELEKDVVRLSENTYISKKNFVIEESKINEIIKCISDLVTKEEFLPISRLKDFSMFPEIGYEWNSFILSEIIKLNHTDDLKIIVPQVEDRRYVKEIVVSKEFPADSYEQLIIYVIKNNNLNGSSLYRLESELAARGLIGRYLPKELYNSKNIYVENDKFYTT